MALAVCASAAALALGASAAAAEGRCGEHPWCNTSLPPQERATLLLHAMSQSDKIGVLTGKEATDVGMPPIKFTDGAVGAGGVQSGASAATAMPSATALAANFDQSMAYSYGSAVGQEVKHRGFDGNWGPTVNIMRTPLGGRTYEAYGEDPFLSGQTAVGWIDGLQAQGVMADVKHFAANNQEGQYGVSPLVAPYGGRQFVNVHVSQRALHEIELTPFEAAITQGHSDTVMCSYNQLEGQYACANPFLLKETFHGLFGSDGFTVSDAVACHEPANDLNAGLNFDIVGSCYAPPLVEGALASGMASQATLEQRVFEVLRKLFAVGFFDHPTWPNNISQDNRAADTAVADATAERGAVLLRNGGALPIDPKTVHSIAVIGPAANQYLRGNGSSAVTPYERITALAGITARAAQAGIKVGYDEGKVPASAQALAKASDLAIVVAGDTESEGVDQRCMSLTAECGGGGQAVPPEPQSTQTAFGNQDELISSVAAANPNTVVVLETGAPVLTPWRASVNALLEAWYPGQDGGTAIAHVLFGDSDPGGRLPVTFPRSEADLPTAPGGMAQYPGTVNPVENCEVNSSVPCPYYQEYYKEGVLNGYRWYDNQRLEPAFPFGFGISYTHFRYGGLGISRPKGAPPTFASFTVTNTGKRAGWAVPQVYLSLESQPGAPEPPRQLAGFAKLQLAPGEKQRVTIPLPARSFDYWSEAENGWRLAKGCVRVEVGPSSRELPLRALDEVPEGPC